jgi:hypothetical protein
VHGCIAGVEREIKGNVVGPGQVGDSGEQEVKMAICSATPGGADCLCIGVEIFLEESNRDSVGLTDDGGEFRGGKPTAVKALFSILRSSVEVSDVVKMVNYVNYELSGEHWLAGSDVRVTLGDLRINTLVWHVSAEGPTSTCTMCHPLHGCTHSCVEESEHSQCFLVSRLDYNHFHPLCGGSAQTRRHAT